MSTGSRIAEVLAKYGRSMTLRRITGTTNQTFTDVTVKGVSKNVNGQALVAGQVQSDFTVVIPDSDIAAASWPSPPHKGDRVILDGQTVTVQSVTTKRLGVEVLVHELQVKG